MPEYHKVLQGNNKGRCIKSNSKPVLETTELDTCIAVSIIQRSRVYMIHSDASDNNGAGKTSLIDGASGLMRRNGDALPNYKVNLL
jgi:hypothetical protein